MEKIPTKAEVSDAYKSGSYTRYLGLDSERKAMILAMCAVKVGEYYYCHLHADPDEGVPLDIEDVSDLQETTYCHQCDFLIHWDGVSVLKDSPNVTTVDTIEQALGYTKLNSAGHDFFKPLDDDEKGV